MTTFAPHRATLEAFVDCIHGGVDKDVLTGLLGMQPWELRTNGE